MLFDLDYYTGGKPPQPCFFQARLEKGILKIPPELYRGEGG
jgi:hypothetical protein